MAESAWQGCADNASHAALCIGYNLSALQHGSVALRNTVCLYKSALKQAQRPPEAGMLPSFCVTIQPPCLLLWYDLALGEKWMLCVAAGPDWQQ